MSSVADVDTMSGLSILGTKVAKYCTVVDLSKLSGLVDPETSMNNS